MQFEHAHLHEGDETGDIVDRYVLFLFALDVDHYAADSVWQRAGEMFLEEALALVAFGTSYERERPIGHVRQDPVGDALVVFGQVALGDLVFRVEYAIRVREPDARYYCLV